MCGIVGYIGKNEATPVLVEGLKTLEYRGYDSSGVAVLNNELNMVKTKGRIADLEARLEGKDIHGTLGIGHTRWATHGEPSDHNAHPHMNEEGTLALVHNGIIENYIQLKEELIDKGYRFLSETDTEIALQLVDLYLKETGDLLEAVAKTVDRVEGSYAFGVVSASEPDKLIAARKESPLVIGIGDGENFIASDVPAIIRHTRDVYFIEDHELVVVTADDITIMDYDKNVKSRDVYNVTWDIEAAEKGGFDHFMIKEIFEQPQAIKDTLTPRLPLDKDEVYLDGIKLGKEELDNINKIYVVACGTAYYAGLSMKYLVEKYARIPVVCEVASEFRYNDPIIDEHTLMVVVSQSGETADTLAALRMAKKAGARVLGVVNAVGSTISREADDVVYVWAGPEIAVASTKAYTTMVCALYLIAMKIAMELGVMSVNSFREKRDFLYKLPEQVQGILDKAPEIEALAKKHIDMKNVFYIGRGLDYAAAMEGALKIKEIAYLHAEPYAAGELKHGPIALIEDNTLLMGLVGQESLYEKTVSNIKEVKSRGASVMAIAMEGNGSIEQVAEDVVYVPRTHWTMAAILENIPQQLFAYYIAKELGHDVDKPRNLAKSVTVE